MELRHLRYFIAVAEAANFTKAASKMRVAQPALSRQIKDLEDEIGVELMLRSPRGITLTAEGRFMLGEARRILAAADEAMLRTRALSLGECGELQIGYGPSPSMELLPPAMQSFKKVVPQIDIHLHDFSGDEMMEGLRNGSLDLCIMAALRGEVMVGIHFQPLKAYPICVAMSPQHPLAKRKALTLEQLKDESLVAFRKKGYTHYHQLLSHLFGGPRKVPRIAIECDGINSLVTEVEAGRGLSILPSISAKTIGSRLKLRSITPAPDPLEVGYATGINSVLTPAAKKFVTHLEAAAKLRA
jgi:DNA-binding transcriptional LysR family regulator